MNRTNETKTPLLVRFEHAIETMDGRHLELHRDDRGSHWIVERRHGRQRTMPLAEYAWECHTAARMLRAAQLAALATATVHHVERGIRTVRRWEWLRRLATFVRRAPASANAI